MLKYKFKRNFSPVKQAYSFSATSRLHFNFNVTFILANVVKSNFYDGPLYSTKARPLQPAMKSTYKVRFMSEFCFHISLYVV